MSAELQDLSEWARRDTSVRDAGLALVARVRDTLPALRRIFCASGVHEAYLFGSMASGLRISRPPSTTYCQRSALDAVAAPGSLYLTTGEQPYPDAVLASPHHTSAIFDPGGFSWARVAALGRRARSPRSKAPTSCSDATRSTSPS